MKTGEELAIVDHLLACSKEAPEEISAYAIWKGRWLGRSADWAHPLDRALAMGLAADRPAWAFAAGYQAAIQALAASASRAVDGLGAVCITEKGGPHPARMAATLNPDPDKAGGWRLAGEKTFVSGGTAADTLYVAAVAGKTEGGKNLLRMAVVDAQSSGVSLEELPTLNIVPEMPHARVSFDGVRLSEADLIPGDGYLGAMKPFRTVEDLHVTAAYLAWVFGVGRRSGWPRETLSAILALVVTARGLATAPSLTSWTHVALGGFLHQAQQLMAGGDDLWDRVPAETRAWWERDRDLLRVAARARALRFKKAWEDYA